MNTRSALACLCGVVALLSLAPVASAQSWSTTPGGPIFSTIRYYSAGQTVWLETYALTPSTADTNLRLFRLDSAQQVVNEVAWDGDSGAGLASRVIWTVPAGQSGFYRVVVHSYFPTSAGQFSMVEFINNQWQATWNQQDFGGSVAYVPSVTAGDLLQTGFEPGDDVADGHQMLLLSSSLGGLDWANSNGPSDTAIIVAPSTASHVWAVTGALQQFDRPLWLFHNDAPNADSDGDGLGDDLETAIGTCVSTNDTVGFQARPCTAGRSADSDLDGLSDYVELLGVDGTNEDLPLRRWGAHPLHKDIFAEVDWDSMALLRDPNWTPTNQWNDQTNPNFPAEPTFAARLRNGFDDGTASELDNPDGVDGIHLHFDIDGVAPWLSKNTNTALFFDGGGSNLVPDTTGFCEDYKARRLDSMDVGRRPFFHYVCVDDADGGRATRPGLSLRVDMDTNGTVVIHELGHNLGLSHGGFEAFNGKPHYISVMNYGFPGDEAPSFNPGNTHFSRNTNAARTLNPESLCETNGLFPTTNTIVDLSSRWFLRTSGTWAIDWNRDGSFTNCLTPVTAPVNWVTRRNADGWSNTEAFSTNRSDLAPATNTSYLGTPAMASLQAGGGDARLFYFYPLLNSAQTDYIRYRSAVFPGGQCAQPVTTFGNACVTFEPERTSGLRGVAVGAASFVHSGQVTMFLAIRDTGGALKVYRTGGAGPGLSFTLEKTVASSGVSGEPTMAVANNQLYLVYTVIDGLNDPRLKWVRRTTAGGWSLPVDVSNGLRTTLPPSLAVNPHDQRLYLLRARTINNGNTLNALQFLVLDAATGTWAPSPDYDLDQVFNQNVGVVTSERRPGLAWRPFDLGNPSGPGAWLIATTRSSRTVMSIFDGQTDFDPNDGSNLPDVITGQIAPNIGEGGIALLDDPNLRHVQGAFVQTNGSLRIMPYADGVFSYGLEDHDDYTYLAVGACRSLMGDDCAIPILPPSYPLTSVEDDCAWGDP